MIEVLKAGPLATVQDLGRRAWRDRGLSRARTESRIRTLTQQVLDGARHIERGSTR